MEYLNNQGNRKDWEPQNRFHTEHTVSFLIKNNIGDNCFKNLYYAEHYL